MLHPGERKSYAFSEMKIPLASAYILLHPIFALWQLYCLHYIKKLLNKSFFSAIMKYLEPWRHGRKKNGLLQER